MSSEFRNADEEQGFTAADSPVVHDNDNNNNENNTVNGNDDEERQQDIETGAQQDPTSMRGPTPEPQVCPVCLEAYEHSNNNDCNDSSNHNSNKKQPMQVEACGHTCCLECMVDYCEYNIGLHRVPVPCPMVGNPNQSPSNSTNNKQQHEGCPEFVSARLIHQILDHDNTFLKKFKRLHRLSLDSTLVSCTRCQEVVPPPPTPLNRSPTVRQCCSCTHVFCSQHGDAHPPHVSCDDFGRSQTTEDALNKVSKPCSHCGARLQKFAGCDHVVCPACWSDMCYKCGTHRHLTGKVHRYCTQCQQGYLDHRYLWRIRLYYCLTMPFALPLLLLYAAIATVGVLASACCFGGFGCGTLLDSQHRKCNPVKGFLYVGLIVLLPFVLMLFDMGYHGRILEEFVQWFLEEDRAAAAPNNNSNSNNQELREAPTAAVSMSSSSLDNNNNNR